MSHFPQYRFENFYNHYYAGGLHLAQVQFLFETAIKKDNDNRTFLAGINGIDLKNPTENKSTSTSSKKQENQSLPLFRDPSEYDNMSKEERDNLTKDMMGKHKVWVNKQLKVK